MLTIGRRRKERAEHLQAEEQLRDLQDRIEAEKNKMMIERSCRQQRDKQTTTLQERYTQLLHYLQEAEEKRSSFEDGLRVAQSKAQKAEALLQTKEAELAYVQRCLETLDVQMLVRCWRMFLFRLLLLLTIGLVLSCFTAALFCVRRWGRNCRQGTEYGFN